MRRIALVAVGLVVVVGCGNNPSPGADGGGDMASKGDSSVKGGDGGGNADLAGNKDGGGGTVDMVVTKTADMTGTTVADMTTTTVADMTTTTVADMTTTAAGDMAGTTVTDMAGVQAVDLPFVTADLSNVGNADLAVVASGDMAVVPSFCGHPGDTGNELGVGSYCLTAVNCAGNSDAVLCATLIDPAAQFCTLQCDPNAANPCGSGAVCGCPNNAGGFCGCIPQQCLNAMNPDMAISGSTDMATTASTDLGVVANGDMAIVVTSGDMGVASGDMAAASSTVTVGTGGAGTGRVTSDVGGISCTGSGGACSASVANGSVINLTAVADTGFHFSGWQGGGCSGTGPCAVTVTGATTVKAGFSAVYFYRESEEQAYSVGYDGSREGTLTPSNTPLPGPHNVFGISGDGMMLAYGATTDPSGNASNTNLWLFDLWTGNAKALTNYTVANTLSYYIPFFSPDGQYLAFVSNQDPTDISPNETLGAGFNIWRVKIDGTGLAPVTNLAADDLRLSDYFNGNPDQKNFAWSPDGQSIVYLASTAVAEDTGASDVYTNLWIVGADGSSPTRLTSFNSMTIGGDPTLNNVVYSPDGKKLAFASEQAPGTDRAGTSDAPTVFNVWTLDLNTKALYCATNFSVDYGVADVLWDASGRLIYNCDKSLTDDSVTDSENYWVSDSDGSNAAPLTVYTGSSCGAAVLQGDGKTYAYESSSVVTDPTAQGNATNIWKLDLSGAPATAITNEADGVYDYSSSDNDD